ncbi:mannan endo-1,6-alpha-mannosidase DCW1 [Sodiomyces alkalinus F11]|uniref:Mannan endo-1,6-alpha-mannosidase n=1 Tax=Sodiomyces alkalinus (strain CBS 110278 / VKM F-3762 / F11) TaxID=1314773 RepID=A0A3N2Q3E8_SODAK|nr:mannan endo-1,6-alpha-mannosidase DCW1 [Sodiomyces alkalinus F11]ROT41237.1 mannan endo-1,6-alpha-mannosidase DCW1 [Sodiomyces alkalinus F11]
MKLPTVRVGTALLLTTHLANAAYYKLDSDDAIRESARTLAFDLMSYYRGNETGQTPGILPGPPPAGDYYWWEAGAMWGAMIDYWQFTGDDTYNDVVMEAMQFQVGEGRDYMPSNVTLSLGNDDQGFWGMSAMLAAEANFPNPPEDRPQWLALAQAVFTTQAAPSRHDETCNGGLRWQIPFANKGFNYKNSISQGCFFNLGARLARYTGNKTYADWADRTWDWMVGVNFIDDKYNIFDGAHVEHNCTDINRAQFSYNNAVFLLGAAYMYNYTDGDETWKSRVEGLLQNTIDVFFPDDIAYEVACEPRMTCTTDMLSFKGYVARWLSTMTQVAPFTAETILPVLRKSAEAAVAQCTGGESGRECGFQWWSGTFDGSVGAGQTMNVLSAVSSLLIGGAKAPVTNATGGTSQGDYTAGTAPQDPLTMKPLTTGDKAGAGIITFLLLALSVSMFAWMSLGDA